MKVEVLISCMFENDRSIIERENIQTDAVVINQCDKEGYEEYLFNNKQGKICKARFFHTKERGLSRSRNMAIKNASGDICLICDNDEVMEDDYAEKIEKAFNENPKHTVICFHVECPWGNSKHNTEYELRIWRVERITSWQIAFRLDDIKDGIHFHEKMGSGTGNGGGEEQKFVMDCIQSGMKAKHVPIHIATLYPAESVWFKGFTERYWIDCGWAAKMIYRKPFAMLWILKMVLLSVWKTDKAHSPIKIASWMIKGCFQER